VDLVSEIKCLHSTVGLLPKKLAIQIRRWDGNAWHLLSSHEPLCLAGAAFTNFLTVVVRGGVRRPVELAAYFVEKLEIQRPPSFCRKSLLPKMALTFLV
jgi:hypothetical protein